MPGTASGERRVLLTIHCTACDAAALAGAVRMAESLGAELAVRFVEDQGLLDWAALPFTREVVFASAQPRALDVADMERSLRAAAETARQRLARLVRDAARLSFEIRRGTPVAELLTALAEADVAIGHVPGDGREGWIAALRAQPQAEDLAATLAELARRSGWPLQVLVVADQRELAALLRPGAYHEGSKRRKHGS